MPRLGGRAIARKLRSFRSAGQTKASAPTWFLFFTSRSGLLPSR